MSRAKGGNQPLLPSGITCAGFVEKHIKGLFGTEDAKKAGSSQDGRPRRTTEDPIECGLAGAAGEVYSVFAVQSDRTDAPWEGRDTLPGEPLSHGVRGGFRLSALTDNSKPCRSCPRMHAFTAHLDREFFRMSR